MNRTKWIILVCCTLAFLAAMATVALRITSTRASGFETDGYASFCQLARQLAVRLEDGEDFLPATQRVDGSEYPASWRMVLLTRWYSDQEYDFSKPWNAPSNLRIAKHEFGNIYDFLDSKYTRILTVVGPNTVFRVSPPISFGDISDGPENTAILIEVTNPNVVYSEPRDIEIANLRHHLASDAPNSFASDHPNGAFLMFADLAIYQIKRPLDAATLEALFTIDGGEPVTRSQLVQDGYLIRRSGPYFDTNGKLLQ